MGSISGNCSLKPRKGDILGCPTEGETHDFNCNRNGTQENKQGGLWRYLWRVFFYHYCCNWKRMETSITLCVLIVGECEWNVPSEVGKSRRAAGKPMPWISTKCGLSIGNPPSSKYEVSTVTHCECVCMCESCPSLCVCVCLSFYLCKKAKADIYNTFTVNIF